MFTRRRNKVALGAPAFGYTPNRDRQLSRAGGLCTRAVGAGFAPGQASLQVEVRGCEHVPVVRDDLHIRSTAVDVEENVLAIGAALDPARSGLGAWPIGHERERAVPLAASASMAETSILSRVA
jgi:hypothetical protein